MPPVISATGNLVKSVFEKENGLEEAVFRRATQEQLQGIHEKHARDIALLQAELGETKLKLGSSEGILQEMRSRNLRLEEQLQAARLSAEVARTQETVAKKELEIAHAEICELQAKIRQFEITKKQQKPE